MKQDFMIMRKQNRESGVALVYALALLGLLLVMLIGFLSSGILEQRTAYNQSSQVGANLLVRSALTQVQSQLGQYYAAGDTLTWMEYCSTVTSNNGQPKKLPAPIVSLSLNGSERTTAPDDSNSAIKSGDSGNLLPLLEQYLTLDNWLPSGKVFMPNWINYTVNDGTNDRLTGRIAYVVIPNLGIDPALLAASGSPLKTGQDYSELRCSFDFLTKDDVDAIAQKTNWLSVDFLTGEDGLNYSKDDEADTKTGSEFYSGEATKKELANYYFTTMQPTVKDQYCPEKDEAFAPQDTRIKLGSGATIPTVSDLTGSNGLLAYTASGTQRNQIAANLIDYMDSDSKPTSDIDSSCTITPTAQNPNPQTWDNTIPTYTGNEKTPYINQIVPAVAGNYLYSVQISEPNANGAVDVTETISGTVDFKAWVELINPYDVALTGAVTAKDLAINVSIHVRDGEDEIPGSPRVINFSQPEITSEQAVSVPAQDYALCYTASSAIGNFNIERTTQNVTDLSAISPLTLTMTIDSISLNRTLLKTGLSSTYYVDYAPSMAASSIPLFANVNLSVAAYPQANAATGYANFEALDPRCNLLLSDWDFKSGTDLWPTLYNKPTQIWQAVEDKPGMNLGKKNDSSKIQNDDVSEEQDLEPSDDPAKVSTAYIRNAPMKSLWELGLIHRGVCYQTLNLKSALNPLDANYSSNRESYWNDAQLLDRATLNSDTTKLKKYNINLPPHNLAAFKPLTGAVVNNDGSFSGAYYYDPSKRIDFNQNTVSEFPAYSPEQDSNAQQLTDNQVNSLQEWIAQRWYNKKTKSYLRYVHRGMLANVITDWAMNGDSPYKNKNCWRDAQLEELIGKIVPLTRCGDTYEYFTVFAVAQTIKDVGSASGDKVIYKYDDDGEHAKVCKYGEIDYDGDFMFDEITGVSYLVARIRREIVSCENTENCQQGIHEPGCKFKVKVLESYVLKESDL